MTNEKKENKRQVNSWTLLFIGTLLISAILNLVGFVEDVFSVVSLNLPTDTLVLILFYDFILFGSLIYFQTMTAIAFYNFEPTAVRLAQLTLLLLLITTTISILLGGIDFSYELLRPFIYVIIWGSFITFSNTIKENYPERKTNNHDVLAFITVILVVIIFNAIAQDLTATSEQITYEKYEECLEKTSENECNAVFFNWCMEGINDSDYCDLYLNCLKQNKDDDYCTSQYFITE